MEELHKLLLRTEGFSERVGRQKRLPCRTGKTGFEALVNSRNPYRLGNWGCREAVIRSSCESTWSHFFIFAFAVGSRSGSSIGSAVYLSKGSEYKSASPSRTRDHSSLM